MGARTGLYTYIRAQAYQSSRRHATRLPIVRRYRVAGASARASRNLARVRYFAPVSHAGLSLSSACETFLITVIILVRAPLMGKLSLTDSDAL